MAVVATVTKAGWIPLVTNVGSRPLPYSPFCSCSSRRASICRRGRRSRALPCRPASPRTHGCVAGPEQLGSSASGRRRHPRASRCHPAHARMRRPRARSKLLCDVTTALRARSKLLFAATKAHCARTRARSPACKARVAGTTVLCAVCKADQRRDQTSGRRDNGSSRPIKSSDRRDKTSLRRDNGSLRRVRNGSCRDQISDRRDNSSLQRV